MAKRADIETFVITGAKRIGLATSFFPLPPGESKEFPVESIDLKDQEVAKSALGLPVYSNLIFEEGNYEDLEGNQINYAPGGFRIDSIVMIVTNSKSIVKTPVVDRAETVKEHIAQGDYIISATGTLVGENGTRPDQLIRDFGDIMRVPQAVTVTSVFLQALEITQIVIETSDIAQRQGSQNVVDFSFTASSDTPLEVELLNNV